MESKKAKEFIEEKFELGFPNIETYQVICKSVELAEEEMMKKMINKAKNSFCISHIRKNDTVSHICTNKCDRYNEFINLLNN